MFAVEGHAAGSGDVVLTGPYVPSLLREPWQLGMGDGGGNVSLWRRDAPLPRAMLVVAADASGGNDTAVSLTLAGVAEFGSHHVNYSLQVPAPRCVPIAGPLLSPSVRPSELAAALRVLLPFAAGSAAQTLADAPLYEPWLELYGSCQQALLFGCSEHPLITGGAAPRVCNVSMSLAAHAELGHLMDSLAESLNDTVEAVVSASDG